MQYLWYQPAELKNYYEILQKKRNYEMLRIRSRTFFLEQEYKQISWRETIRQE